MHELKFRQIDNENERGDIILIESLMHHDGQRCVQIKGRLYYLKDTRMKEWFDLFAKGFISMDVFPAYAEIGILPSGLHYIEVLDDNKEYIKAEPTDRAIFYLYGAVAQSIIRKDMEEENN